MSQPEFRPLPIAPPKVRTVVPDPVTARRLGLANVMIGSVLIVVCTLPAVAATIYSPTISGIGRRLIKPFYAKLADGIKQDISDMAEKEAKETDPVKRAKLTDRRKRLEATLPSLQVSPTIGFDAMDDPRIRLFTFVNLLVGLVLHGVLLISGVGLLGLRSWGREMGLVAAIGRILHDAIYSILHVVWVTPMQIRAMEPQLATQKAQAGAAGMGFLASPAFVAGASYIGLFLTVAVSLLYTAILLFFLLKPSVRVACGVVSRVPSEHPAP